MATLSMDNSNIIGISYSQMNSVKVSMKRAQQMLETSQRNLSTARVQLQVDRGRLRITEDSLSNLYSEASKRKTKIDKICNNIDYTVRRFKEVDSRCAANIKAIGKYYNSQVSIVDRIKNSILGIGKYLFNGFTSLLEEGANAFDFLKTKAYEAYNAVSEFMEAHPWIGNTIGVIGGIGQMGVYALLLTPPFTPIGVAGMAFGFNSAVYSGTKLINNITNGSNEGINVLENVFSLFGDGGKTAYNILDMGFAIATIPIEGGFALSKASQIVKESNGTIKGLGALSKGIKEVEKMKVDKLSNIFSSTLGKIIEPISKTSEYFKNSFGDILNFRGFMPQLAGQGSINIAISMSDVIDYAKAKEIAGVVGIISKESGLIYNAMDKAGDILKGSGGGSNATEGAAEAKKLNLEDFSKEVLETKPMNSPIPEKWLKKGGSISIDENGIWTYTNKAGQSVSYPNGYPDFTEYTHPAVKPVEIEVAIPKNPQADFKAANEMVGLNKSSNPPVPAANKPPEGYTWHHHEDGKTMILVDEDIHREFRHIGGQSTTNGKNRIGE